MRIEALPDDDVPSRPVGGTLKTLLYMTQLAAISQDPWFSRMQSLQVTDHIAFDLDPMPAPRSTRCSTSRGGCATSWRRSAPSACRRRRAPKGLHVFVPMPTRTPFETGRIWAQIVATIVATRHPESDHGGAQREEARRKVYVDYLQNIEGKTLACAYSGARQ